MSESGIEHVSYPWDSNPAVLVELLVDELDPEVGVRAVVDLIAGEGVERVGSGESTRQKVSW